MNFSSIELKYYTVCQILDFYLHEFSDSPILLKRMNCWHFWSVFGSVLMVFKDRLCDSLKCPFLMKSMIIAASKTDLRACYSITES